MQELFDKSLNGKSSKDKEPQPDFTIKTFTEDEGPVREIESPYSKDDPEAEPANNSEKKEPEEYDSILDYVKSLPNTTLTKS